MANPPASPKTRVFVDSSVLFSAAFSPNGASRAVIAAAIRGHLEIWLSGLVLQETERNLASKAPNALLSLRELLDALGLVGAVQMTEDPSDDDVAAVLPAVNAKDAPLIAAALTCKSVYFVTLDKALIDECASMDLGIQVVRPEAAL